MQIYLKNILVTIIADGPNTKVVSELNDIILKEQTIAKVSELMTDNFDIVFHYYSLLAEESRLKNIDFDLQIVSYKVVVYYLAMYNQWRLKYKKQENRDLHFHSKDLNHPSTHDILIHHFHAKYPDDWEQICSVLMKMGLEEFTQYYQNRLQYYDK